jgi:hypothetical protein
MHMLRKSACSRIHGEEVGKCPTDRDLQGCVPYLAEGMQSIFDLNLRESKKMSRGIW